jgi:hypothetical protein
VWQQPSSRWFGAKHFARSILGLATLAAVVMATILGGQRYFYCRPMDRVMTDIHCPCAQSTTDDEHATSFRILNDCFEVRILPRLISSTIGNDLAVPTATLIAMLPAAHWVSSYSGRSVARADHPIRAGPYSPTALRAQLMVFLI